MAENKQDFSGVIEQLKNNKEAIDSGTEQNRISLSNVNKNLAFRLQNIGKDFAESVALQQDAIIMQRQIADEQERKALLDQNKPDPNLDPKNIGGDGLTKTFKTLKGLIGGVALSLGGILLFVKALQDKVFQGAVKDLFDAMKKVFDLLIELGAALMPIATTILTYTVKGLTLFFESVASVFEHLKDFNDNAKIEPEDYKGIAPLGAATVASLARFKAAITGASGTTATMAAAAEDANTKSAGIVQKTLDKLKFRLVLFKLRAAIALEPLTKTLTTLTKPIRDSFNSIRGGFMSISSRLKQILQPLDKLRKTLTNIMAPLAKLPVISSVTNFFSSGASKAGGFLKFLGKLFLPFTIIIGLVDTVKGFYNGFFGKDLEEGEEAPEGFVAKLMAGIEGGVTGLVNSLVGAPLDFLKGAVGWVLGKMGFTGAEEALASFRFSDVFSDILSIIFNPIDSMVALFRKIMSFDIMGWLTENVPGFGAIVDFFTEDDFDRVKREIRENRNTENQIARQQQYIDGLVEDLESGRLNEDQAERARQEIERRLGVIRLARLESGLTEEGITQRIAELEEMAAAAEGGDKKKLQKRIEELEQEQLELAQSKNIVVITNDNKQTQFNSTKGTYSVGKSTSNNDATMDLLHKQYGGAF